MHPGTVKLTTGRSDADPRTASDLPIAVRRRTPDAVYVHVPFCFHKCHYCDFYSFVDAQGRQGVFVDRLIDELDVAARSWDDRVQTVFVGGGTPTLLEPAHLRRLLEALSTRLHLDGVTEFTVEANPETVTEEIADILAAGGVNRVSVGAQSFHPAHLRTLERWHDPANVARTVTRLRAAGITNLNLDLIFAIPGQGLEEWCDDLRTALDLGPDHLSCYGLTYEPNTAMTRRLEAGLFRRVDDDLEAQMLEATLDHLAAAGCEHYEISNWARLDADRSRRCRHNLVYWTNGSWWPLGPSAAGHVEGWRWKNVPRLGDYLDAGPWAPITDVEHLDEDVRIGERFLLGLRLREGMESDDVSDLLARGERGAERRAAIERHLAGGLLEQVDAHLRLTRRGVLLADTVLADLV